MQGNFFFLGSGTATFIGSPLIDHAAIGFWAGQGEYIAVGGRWCAQTAYDVYLYIHRCIGYSLRPIASPMTAQ